MGFPRDKVAGALSISNWNEEAALNYLLTNNDNNNSSKPPTGAPRGPPPVSSALPPSKSVKPAGLFSNWGKK